jgi:asparagine synthetase B (glutamine-hydrolysing)
MCGIAGFVNREGERATSEEVRRMINTIVHRGPDDEGIHAQGNVGLGMRRLSIIDLSGGRQPIYNEDRSVSRCSMVKFTTFWNYAKSWRVAAIISTPTQTQR